MELVEPIKRIILPAQELSIEYDAIGSLEVGRTCRLPTVIDKTLSGDVLEKAERQVRRHADISQNETNSPTVYLVTNGGWSWLNIGHNGIACASISCWQADTDYSTSTRIFLLHRGSSCSWLGEHIVPAELDSPLH